MLKYGDLIQGQYLDDNVGGWLGSNTNYHPDVLHQLGKIPPAGELFALGQPDRIGQTTQKRATKGEGSIGSGDWYFGRCVWSCGGQGFVANCYGS